MFTETFSTKTGTLSGTLLVLLLNINWVQLANTAMVAAVGAGTSYLISVLLKWLFKKPLG